MAADAVVLLTDHDAFDYELVASSAPYIFDARNRCRHRMSSGSDPDAMASHGPRICS